MKKELSSLDIHVLVRELSEALTGGHIDKAYQPSYDEVVLTVTGGNRPRRRLLIHIGGFLCITERFKEMPQQPSPYAMLLRKHISNARIVSVQQHGFDRIVVLHLFARGESYRLVCELFRNGTVILVKGDEIVKPLTSKSWGSRDVKAGKEFLQPPSRANPYEMDFEAFTELMRSSKADLVRTLATQLGLGGEYAEGLVDVSQMSPDRPAAEMALEELGLLFENLRVLFMWADEDPRPHIVRRLDEPETVLPVGLPLEPVDVVETYESFNAAVDAYFAEVLTEAEWDDVSEEFMGRVERLEHQAEQQRRAERDFEAGVKVNQRRGDLIYANYKHCEAALRDLLDAKEALGWKEVERRVADSELVKELNPYDGYVVLPLSKGDGPPEDVKLRLNLTVPENAEFYYERVKRAREKAAGAREALEGTVQRLERARERLEAAREKGAVAVEEAVKGTPMKARRRHFWFEKYRWVITSDGTVVVAGRDASSNERVVKKYLKDRDRYCHADFQGAPSVVVKDPGGGVSERALEEACGLAVVYSKAWSAGRASADAYWVLPEQVSKTPRSGEYVPKGGFIIRGRRNYVKDLEMRLAVGLVDHEDELLAMGGPVQSVMARAERWVELVPSNDKKEATAKEVARLLGVDLDTVIQALPPGGCRIDSTHGFEAVEP